MSDLIMVRIMGVVVLIFVTFMFRCTFAKTIPEWMVPWSMKDASEQTIRLYLRFWCVWVGIIGSVFVAAGTR